jgi:hypothetical protein
MTRRSTRTRPRHNSVARSLRAHRGARITFGVSGDLPRGGESVRFDDYLKRHVALVNPHGRTCSGVGETSDEALRRARARADELNGKQGGA